MHELLETLCLSHPSIRRGRVWCVVCGASRTIDPRKGFAEGWPKCCGQTMTIDSPEERAALRAREGV